MYTILIVDDNPSIVAIFVRMLEQGGYRTFSAGSGEETLKILENARPDMILLDIIMEPMDGWQTLERIKPLSPVNASIPVLMLTSKDLTPDDAEQYGHYFEDYIKKPITRQELFEAIERFFLHRDRMEIQLQIAGEAGADPGTIEEYRNLCSDIDAQKRLVRILRNVMRTIHLTPDEKREYETVVQSMEGTLTVKCQRLEEIVLKYPLLGASSEEGPDFGAGIP
jgi:two-component system, OmpR family, response regulator